jgi:dephospho-CoA kinase
VRQRIVGLTGGIASGKSTVSRMLGELGSVIIDADVAARHVVAPGSDGLARIVEEFGKDVLLADGTLNRKLLGRIIFGDHEARRRLDSITHPLIYRHMAQELDRAIKAGASVIILDIPLLFETGLFLDTIDESVVVYVRPEVQLERLMARDGLREEEARQRIRAQLPLEEKARRAEHVIDNSGSLEETRRQVVRLWQKWSAEHETGLDRP